MQTVGKDVFRINYFSVISSGKLGFCARRGTIFGRDCSLKKEKKA